MGKKPLYRDACFFANERDISPGSKQILSVNGIVIMVPGEHFVRPRIDLKTFWDLTACQT